MGNRKAITLAFLDDEVVVGMGECVDYIERHGTSDRLSEFYVVLPVALHQPGPEEDSISSLWGAEQYSVIEKASSKKLMLGTSLGETLTLDALPAISMDTEQREWSLRNIVDLSPDGLTNSRAMIGKVVPGLAVTISFQEEHILRWARCNSYEASLRIDGEATVIGPPSATALSCEHPKDVLGQEFRYFAILPQVTWAGTYGERLFMSTGTGKYLMFEAE